MVCADTSIDCSALIVGGNVAVGSYRRDACSA
jgi:hypothetical protein